MKKIDLLNREEPIQRLQTDFADNGHIYKLHIRNDVVAVYEQYDKTTGNLVGYELTEVTRRKEEVIKGTKYPRRETRPNTASWGENAYTLMWNASDEYIDKRFKELTEIVKNKLTKRDENSRPN